ncbi:MAG: alpha/beta fold hydrolase [Candidatus Heimdallarchaeota archaeon]|nr:alpha/beta fold hydrolase [Candidatus Heimdallarchaeota archaeon]MCK4876886.1 alpha/beta fold hydrolase [Candidatus Heimdallarchaeota archaeon]
MFSNEQIGFLLIHGFTGTHFEMIPFEEFLTEKGFTVRNITLPGHETTEEDLTTKKWTDWIDFAQLNLDELKNECKKVFVSGLSMGGTITLLLGAKNNDLSGIITLAAVYRAPDWRMHLLSIPFAHYVYPRYKNEESGWEDLEALSTHKSYEHYPIKSVSELYKMLKETKKQVKNIQVPILVIQGKKDLSVLEKQAKWILNNVNTSDKQLVWIEKGGHVIPKDAGRYQLFETVDSWLKGRI